MLSVPGMGHAYRQAVEVVAQAAKGSGKKKGHSKGKPAGGSPEEKPEEAKRKRRELRSAQRVLGRAFGSVKPLVAHKLCGQVFLGMHIMSVASRPEAVAFSWALRSSGIRLVLADKKTRREAIPFARRMGLEDEFNSVIQLSRDAEDVLDPNIAHAPYHVARLPQTPGEVRGHVERIDDVPLRAGLFCGMQQSTDVVELVRLFQDYGEHVCVIGTTAKSSNAVLFASADAGVSVGVLPHPLLGPAPLGGAHVRDDGTSESACLYMTPPKSSVDAARRMIQLSCAVALTGSTSVHLPSAALRGPRVPESKRSRLFKRLVTRGNSSGSEESVYADDVLKALLGGTERDPSMGTKRISSRDRRTSSSRRGSGRLHSRRRRSSDEEMSEVVGYEDPLASMGVHSVGGEYGTRRLGDDENRLQLHDSNLFDLLSLIREARRMVSGMRRVLPFVVFAGAAILAGSLLAFLCGSGFVPFGVVDVLFVGWVIIPALGLLVIGAPARDLSILDHEGKVDRGHMRLFMPMEILWHHALPMIATTSIATFSLAVVIGASADVWVVSDDGGNCPCLGRMSDQSRCIDSGGGIMSPHAGLLGSGDLSRSGCALSGVFTGAELRDGVSVSAYDVISRSIHFICVLYMTFLMLIGPVLFRLTSWQVPWSKQGHAILSSAWKRILLSCFLIFGGTVCAYVFTFLVGDVALDVFGGELSAQEMAIGGLGGGGGGSVPFFAPQLSAGIYCVFLILFPALQTLHYHHTSCKIRDRIHRTHRFNKTTFELRLGMFSPVV